MTYDHITPPYMRQELHRARLISLEAVPEAIKSRRPFKSSHFKGEWLRDAYIVWIGGHSMVIVYAHGEWFARELKIRPKKSQELWGRIVEQIQPTIIDDKYMPIAILHGKEGVVRRMMGLER